MGLSSINYYGIVEEIFITSTKFIRIVTLIRLFGRWVGIRLRNENYKILKPKGEIYVNEL